MTAINYSSQSLTWGLKSLALPGATPPSSTAAGAAPGAAASDDDSFGFDDLLDVVNPLQHIPVVSTLYRAITGDTIKTGPKIAGDTLYGGLTGLAGSVADTIFEKLTGKSVGDTVLAYVEDMFSPDKPDTALASTATPTALPATALALPTPTLSLAPQQVAALRPAIDVAPPTSAPAPPQTTPDAPTALASADAIVIPGQDALLMALSRNGIGQDVAMRAADAYRRTLNVAGTAQATALR